MGGNLGSVGHWGTHSRCLGYWLLKGKRGALQAVTFTAFLLFGTQFAKTVISANLDSVLAVFLFGAGAALVAFLVTWLLSRLVDTTRKRQRSRLAQ
jgi:hypothetical protein